MEERDWPTISHSMKLLLRFMTEEGLYAGGPLLSPMQHYAVRVIWQVKNKCVGSLRCLRMAAGTAVGWDTTQKAATIS